MIAINQRTIEGLYDFNKMNKDCCSVIGAFVGKKIDVRWSSNWNGNNIEECKYCNHKDMDNEDNFVNVCCCCDVKCCKSCYNNKEYDICNEDEDEEENWLCNECGAWCEGCSQYVYEEDMRGLLDSCGDMEGRCCNCLNDRSEIKDIVFDYDDTLYLKKECKIDEDADFVGCDDDCEKCNVINDCNYEDDCKCIDCNSDIYGGEEYKSCNNECKVYCLDCSKKVKTYSCMGCCDSYNEKNVFIYRLSDCINEYVCEKCINDNIFYM